jgi:hypothetical protein
MFSTTKRAKENKSKERKQYFIVLFSYFHSIGLHVLTLQETTRVQNFLGKGCTCKVLNHVEGDEEEEEEVIVHYIASLTTLTHSHYSLL